MNDFIRLNNRGDSKKSTQKELLKDICKGLGISSPISEASQRGKVVSTYESISERSNTNLNSLNLEFSPANNQRLSKVSNFEKNYRKVMEEFNPSILSQSQLFSPSNRTISVDFDQKLKLKALQSQMDTKKVQKRTDFSAKLKDLKLNFITSNTGSTVNESKFNGNVSLLSPKLDKTTISFDPSQNSLNNLSITKLKQNELISDKTKLKIFDCMKKTKEFTNANGGENALRVSFDEMKNSNNTNRITKENLMAEFKMFDVESGSKSSRGSGNNNFYLQSKRAKNSFNNTQDDFWGNSSLSTIDSSRKRVKENAKKEIVSLLHQQDNRESKKFSRLKFIQNEDNGMSLTKNHFNLSCNTYLNTEKYPSEIVTKMQKKFPDLVKTRSYISSSKNYLEKDKIEKMKSKIDKFL